MLFVSVELSENYDPRDESFMQEALIEAQKAFDENEVPVGAVIVCGGKIIARGHNQTEQLNDVTAHAEMIALTAAAEALGGKYLTQCTLYVTVEPCIMCAGAIGWSQVRRLVIGARDSKRGFLQYCSDGKSPLHPKTIVNFGVREEGCSEIMKLFFKNKRK